MKKYKVLSKDIFKEIWKTKSRFLSILSIVMLGSGFFAGVKSTCPDMSETAQAYYATQNLMDFQLKSTMGFTKNDIKTLSDQPDVAHVQPGYSVDAFLNFDDTSDKVVRAYSIGKEDKINQPIVKEGHLPQSKNQCVVENNNIRGTAIQVGDTIALTLDPDEDLSAALNTTEFEVVGIVQSPMYINFERGRTTMGNGSISSFLYLPTEAFNYEVYTDVFLTYADLAGQPFYLDGYKDAVKTKADTLEQLATLREKTRIDEIRDEANVEITKAEVELDQGIADYEQGKADFKTEIDKANKTLAEGLTKLNANQQLLDQKQLELTAGSARYESGLQEYALSKSQVEVGFEQAEQGRVQINSAQSLVRGIQEVLQSFSTVNLPQGAPIPADVAAVIESSQGLTAMSGVDFKTPLTQYLYMEDSQEKVVVAANIQSALTPISLTLTDQSDSLDSTVAKLQAASAELAQAQATLTETRSQLDHGQAQLNQGRVDLRKGRDDYNKGLAELKTQTVDGRKKLDDALLEIEDGKASLLTARHELSELGTPEWYVFDRSNNPGYSQYTEDALRVDRVAAVFPVFFILVAALVCLTTMTRMVEEQRIQIGTLKSLGYSRGATVAKYVIYALSASLIGSILGLLIGFKLFPTVIFTAYRMMYVMPDIITSFRWDYAILCIIVSTGCTSLAALMACYNDLRESPAQLMRPVPPKTGKRVLLERITFIWNRLSFLRKVTIRNLFRYKKRIYMTVVGIAGCTALMMAGFGLQHAISSIVDKQYTDIFTYDVLGIHQEDITDYELEEISTQLEKNDNISASMLVNQTEIEASAQKSPGKTAYLFVPQDVERLPAFISLQHRTDGQPVSMSPDGAIITEKLAKSLDIKAGDTITLHRTDKPSGEILVADITENYLMNFIYISPTQYEAVFGEAFTSNAFMSNMIDVEGSDQLSTSLLKNNNILALNYSIDGGRKFSDIVEALNYIVFVLILCAGALAFIVLYNLANINIEERMRELATIKLLGFYDGEVSAYVRRESTLSALIGMLVGLAVGVPLVNFIVVTASVEAVMFNPQINIGTFVFSAMLTMIFTYIVNFVMHYRLKKVDMVSSLKSVE